MKRVWKKPRRLHGVCDERSGKAVDGDGGGTGGHVFPGLAVAHHLMDQGWQVRWLGTADRMEADLVPKNGIEIDFIRISGLRGKGIKAQLLAPVRIFNAWRQARAIMKRFQPDVVLGMGGYVSGPGGLAAWSLGSRWSSTSKTALPA
ncbi:UDP-N-acetylglucosamine-N-acetylmuramyl-(pentapeptide) pyrophosphoryl-undecaprenol N-acetylglucosamine transferase [Klebsiella pneumoniae subsp. rhinoscleromatis]|nr:UDP-N-acetylglucosamine-N-acetylmuramyl-(pentapeptide) pyrophosphoryl-undecaprenol N-acetylglucosamine transferase [Klebsiella pneumoniae subsp. rhinoscleromatis]